MNNTNYLILVLFIYKIYDIIIYNYFVHYNVTYYEILATYLLLMGSDRLLSADVTWGCLLVTVPHTVGFCSLLKKKDDVAAAGCLPGWQVGVYEILLPDISRTRGKLQHDYVHFRGHTCSYDRWGSSKGPVAHDLYS
jgi:hypothetical protein